MEQNGALGEANTLRQPTVAVPVRLSMVAGAIVDAELFVPDTVRTGRTQLLEDLATHLEDDSTFVPVRMAGDVQLLSKRAIAWVSIPRAAADEEVDFEETPSDVVTLYDRQHRVSVDVSGSTFEGSLFDSSPADRPRVIDHLNRARRFLRLWTPDAQTLINTDQIVAVREQR